MLNYEKEEWVVINQRCKRPTVEIDCDVLNALLDRCIPENYTRNDVVLPNVVRPVLIVDRKQDYEFNLSPLDKIDNAIQEEIDITEEDCQEVSSKIDRGYWNF